MHRANPPPSTRTRFHYFDKKFDSWYCFFTVEAWVYMQNLLLNTVIVANLLGDAPVRACAAPVLRRRVAVVPRRRVCACCAHLGAAVHGCRAPRPRPGGHCHWPRSEINFGSRERSRTHLRDASGCLRARPRAARSPRAQHGSVRVCSTAHACWGSAASLAAAPLALPYRRAAGAGRGAVSSRAHHAKFASSAIEDPENLD